MRIFPGGYIDKSTEEYTYVRGRGRGRYVYEECGIRCKKPSTLKKKTHTDSHGSSSVHLPPVQFQFKTKGNTYLKKYFLIEFEYSRLLNFTKINRHGFAI